MDKIQICAYLKLNWKLCFAILWNILPSDDMVKY